MTGTVEIRRGHDRGLTTTDWLTSRHSFSFGDFYDPDNTHHGVLLVNNDDIVAPGGGFDTHAHRDMEIVTWVLEGTLAHRDSIGNSGVIHPGLAQRMSAGTGVQHSEMNGSPTQPVHFIQMWVLPDRSGIDPGYQQQEVALTGELTPIASGMHDGAPVTIHNKRAALHGARMQAGDSVELPEAPHLHLFVARGAATVQDAGPISEGDAVRFTAADGRRVTAAEPAEILVWEMHANLGAT